MVGTRRVPLVIVVVVLFAALIACGPMPEPAPTTTVQTTPPVEERAATPGTPKSAELTLGELAERVNDAWRTVRSYRITFTGSTLVMPAGLGTPVARSLATPNATPMATPGATPVARPRETFVSIREVVLPDRQRQDVRGLGGNDHEAVAMAIGSLSVGRSSSRSLRERQVTPGSSSTRHPSPKARCSHACWAVFPRPLRPRWRRSLSGCCRSSSAARWESSSTMAESAVSMAPRTLSRRLGRGSTTPSP